MPTKRWAIIRSQPVMVSGYPYPECILGGWTALLTRAEKAVVDAKVSEYRQILGYTGFDALDADAQQAIRDKLDANKQWEKQNGCLWFKAPQKTVDASRWYQDRRRQVAQMIADDSYPVRTVIYRS
jgi:hypothetical protein